VALRTADGVRLSAWYVPPRNGAAVVLLPGAGSTRTAVLGQAAVLARHGYGALLVDSRGHGRSGGHAMDFGWWGGRDITAAVSYLTRQPGVQPGKIAVLGLSMGGEQAIAALATQPRAWDEQVTSFLNAALNPAAVAAVPMTGRSAARPGRPALPRAADGSRSRN
jgi:dipeptidyl aminopeptidase/acylaminoacyl peptidase